ncbi:MAG: tRNA 4-thiouridine(8) synthase ThiI [Lachnospiraceae bacterium]|nr:tRNA 4-thiouridine(8) synthase ThiI [Candidatus Equihabitans merdae]
MYNTFLIKYGEIGIKGNNRHVFEDALCKRIRLALAKVSGEFNITKERGRIYVRADGEWHYEETLDALKHVFGIVGICPVMVIPATDFAALAEAALQFLKETYPGTTKSFKVKAKRINKGFEKNSMEIDADLGEIILENCPTMHVDVHHPDILLDIEIRDNIYIYSETIPGPGGMPIGTGGNATLLLSGGIDSPVAGYMVARRGVAIDAVYFHAPPYTSERAKQKVVDLAKALTKYTGPIRLHVVNFTDIQLAIYDICPHEELTIIMRRYMMRIAEHFAKQNQSLGLITGESIGQVASQTMQSLLTTNAVCTLPVYRPLIAFDKNDIVTIAKDIGTYETSILPYEDCCTIFVAKHPVTKPTLPVIERSEQKLNKVIDDLMKQTLESTEVIVVE